MPSLRVRVIANPLDEIGFGSLELDVRDEGRTPLRFRLARHQNDLPYAHWRTPEADIMDIPWMFSAFQNGNGSFICAEIEYDTGANAIVSTTAYMREDFIQRPYRATLWTDPGYLIRVKPKNDRDSWPMVQYGDTNPGGNNWRPFDVSDGYAWCSENSRTIDVGETPDDIILAHAYARYFEPSNNTWNFGPSTTTLVAILGSDGLDLKGAICVWGVLCIIDSGPHAGKQARYHLLEPLTFGSGATLHTNQRVFPSGSHPNWRCSFVSDGVALSAVPAGPSFNIVALELILRLPESGGAPVNLTDPPTGLIKIKEFAVKQ